MYGNKLFPPMQAHNQGIYHTAAANHPLMKRPPGNSTPEPHFQSCHYLVAIQSGLACSSKIAVRCVQSGGWLRLLDAGSDVPVTGSSGSVVDAVSAWTRFIELPAAMYGSCVVLQMFVAQAWSFGGKGSE